MTDLGPSAQRIVVAQLGARRHYAVPLALHAHGLLQHFFTDLYVKRGWQRQVLRGLGRAPGLAKTGRLASRYTPGLPGRSVTQFPSFGFLHGRASRRAHDPSERTRAWLEGGSEFATRVAAHLGTSASAVYVFSSAGLEILQRARDLGQTGILDHATAPRRAEAHILRQEAERFPGWASSTENQAIVADYAGRQRAERACADVILCGSSYVRGLVEGEDGASRKVVVMPLGLAHPIPHLPTRSYAGRALRVLYLGNEGLRKGVGDLAAAARMCESSSIEVRVGGDLGLTPQARATLRSDLDLLGPVDRAEVPRLFQWADVFVLPSLSETFGLVLLEAMAAGLPVITTPHTAGPDIIRDGEDGFIVPVRDPAAIAGKLDLLATKPALLEELSRNAHQRAREFTLERYSERLVKAIGHVTVS